MKQVVRKVAVGMATVALACGSTMAAKPGVYARPILPGIVDGSPVFISGSGGDLTVNFDAVPTVSIPPSDTGTCGAEVKTSFGNLAGDYDAGKVQGIIFKIRRNVGSGPVRVGLTVTSRDVGMWRFERVLVPDATGTWVTNTVSIDRRAGWMMEVPPGYTEEQKDDLWKQTLRSVCSVSVMVTRRGYEAESYSVDDLVLFGDGFMTKEAKLTASLMDAFGVQSTADLAPGQLMADSDRDGVSDVDAVQAGKDPGLAVSILDVTAVGVRLEWPCVAKKTYTLYRSETMSGEFLPIAVVPASESGYMTYMDAEATGAGPFFYKVKKQ